MGATDFIFLLFPPPALTCHACSLRLSRVCGRSSKEECLPLFVLFVLFGQAKSTWYFMYFCMTKSTKSHLRRSLLEISLSFPALPKREQYTPSRANISSESSDRRQRQKCRFHCTGCLLDLALCPFPLCQSALSALALSAHRLHTRPPHLYMRAWNQRIRESARLLRVMCSHAWYRESCAGETELSFFTLIAARTHLPRTASCDSVAYAEGVQKRNAFLFLSFSYFSDKRKVPCAYCYSM